MRKTNYLKIQREQRVLSELQHHARDSEGFGLIEIMIAAAVGSVVMLSMSTMMNSMNKSVRSTRTLSSRDQLTSRIAREAGNPTALGKSLAFTGPTGGFPANPVGGMLDKCINGGGPTDCVSLSAPSGPSVYHGMTLVDAMGNPIAGPDAAHAAVYDVNGALCSNASVTAANTNCPIIATASFTPICPNGGVSCAKASAISVKYVLDQGADLSTVGGTSFKATDFPPVTTAVPFPGNTGGEIDKLAKWVSNSELGASVLHEDPTTHFLGIGTTAPWATFNIEDSKDNTADSPEAGSIIVRQRVAPATTSDATFSAGIFQCRSNANQNLNSGMVALAGQSIWFENTATMSQAYGVEGVTRNVSAGSGVVGAAIGIGGTVKNEKTGTIGVAIGVQGRVFNYKPTGTITTAYGGHFELQPISPDPNIDGAHKLITTGYGVYIGNVEASTKYALFSADSTAPSVFNGSVTVGATIPGWNTANPAMLYVGKTPSGPPGPPGGRSINAAGSINDAGHDFAEWVDWGDGPKPEMGSVILYKGIYVVVSSLETAAFVGNDKKDLSNAILVAFAGQLPVLTRGPVHIGDLIIGNGDGTGRAVARKDVTIEMAQKAVGTAWEASDDSGLKRVNVAVGLGLGGGGARDNEKLKQENAALSKELGDLKSRLSQIEKALKIR